MSTKSRHLERFMPYDCARDGLVIRGVRVAVDDTPLGELASGGVLPWGPAPWDSLHLTVALERRVPLDGLLYPDEYVRAAVSVVLGVHCWSTFLSQSHPLRHSDPTADKFEHVITLRRDDLRGAVSITPSVVRSTAHTPRPGLAASKGAWLMKGEPWVLFIDETKPRHGTELEILRKRFSEVPDLSPEDHHNWFALRFDGAFPRLYLNDEHSDLMSALFDTAKRGRRATLRETLYDQIGAAVWPALLLHAARARHENEDEIYPWQANILRLWVRRLAPDESDLDAGVKRLVDRAVHHPAEFSLEINAALQRGEQVRNIQRLLTEGHQ